MSLIKYVDAILNDNHDIECDVKILARQYEHNATALRIHLLDEMLDKNIYIDFEMANGTKKRTDKLEIDMENKTADFMIDEDLTNTAGTILAEIVVEKSDEIVWISNPKRYRIAYSINGADTV